MALPRCINSVFCRLFLFNLVSHVQFCFFFAFCPLTPGALQDYFLWQKQERWSCELTSPPPMKHPEIFISTYKFTKFATTQFAVLNT